MTAPDLVTDPRREAFERVDGRYDVRVLEPSPPAVNEPAYFADDPVAPGTRTGRTLVSPVTNGDLTWDDLARGDPELAAWCAERWLGAWPRLQPLGDRDTLARTRLGWHILAEHVLAPARHAANGRIGLRFTRGGFGTPFFGSDEQARVSGRDLVVVRNDAATKVPITTPRAAAAAVGGGLGAPANVYEPATPLEADSPLDIDHHAARVLGAWYGFGSSVLEELRARAADADPSRVQLWPEHFDLSFDLGDEARATRGTFGASPGDEAHPDPYLYVTHRSDVGADPYWNDDAFGGASLSYEMLVAAEAPRELALDFFRRGRRALGA